MKVLVDTCVWSLALRKKTTLENDEIIIKLLKELIEDGRVAIIGPIRQELLSGLKSEKKFTTLKDYLSFFEDYQITTADYELAASMCNTCRKQGIAGSSVDLLICAVASRNHFSILTIDKDFKRYAKCLNILTFTPS